jgi:transcriptional regulator with XRE-family HTH domain
MFNVVFDPEYRAIPGLLRRLREAAGLSQRQMAFRLGRSQSHIYKLEGGQRPVEIVEFCRLAVAAGVEPADAFAQLLADLRGVGCVFNPAEPASAPIRPSDH